MLRTKVMGLAIVWSFEWPYQSEVAENGLNEFPMNKNLGIDSKITFLACSEP